MSIPIIATAYIAEEEQNKDISLQEICRILIRDLRLREGNISSIIHGACQKLGIATDNRNLVDLGRHCMIILYGTNYNNIDESIVEAIPLYDNSSSTLSCSDTIKKEYNLVLKHISGSSPDKQWCLNNFYAFNDNVIIPTQADGIYHKWMNENEEITIAIPSGVNKIAFSSQDVQIANISINSSKHIDIDTIHWSNDSHRDNRSEWTCQDNNNHKHWSYTVVHINENLDLTFQHVSWSDLLI